MPRSRTTLLGLGAAAATLAATAAVAVAQVIPNPPDNSPGGPLPPSNLVTTTCGPEQTSIVKTQSSPSVTNSVAFQPVAGAATQIVVPEGQSRCVKVLLTAETACEITGANDFCHVQALVDGAPMNPNGTGFQTLQSEDGSAEAGAFEWVKRVGEGAHVIRLERRVDNALTSYWWDDWTFDVSLSL